jgi:hypothetical protein
MIWKPSIHRKVIVVVARRLLFLLALLLVGVISAIGFDYCYNRSRPSGGQSPPILIALGTFMWGADSMSTVLAVWLAGRQGIWRSWSGRFRIVLYVAAYMTGVSFHRARR